MDRGMSRAEARAIWLRHVVDPDRVAPPQLAKARKALIKKAHPDLGGNLEDAKLINAAYDVLRASSLDDASRQRREHELKRQQWEQYQRDYHEQRERERRYQEWVDKRAAQRLTEAQAEEAAEARRQPEATATQSRSEAQPRHRWSIAKLCCQFLSGLRRRFVVMNE